MLDEFTSEACSLISNRSGEPLYASIKPARYWLMLEYDRPYGRKALPDSDLPQAVKAHLDTQAQALVSCRVLLVRQQNRRVSGGLRFFLAVADELSPELYEFDLENYESLLKMDLADLVSQPEKLYAYHRAQPLFLVCTNGRRDPCCALNGLPLYQALESALGVDVWQTSHVGGHRFAANLVCMPHGLFYGRVDVTEGFELVQAYRQGHLVAAHYRGRACYPKIIQAAEYFLRHERNLPEIKRLRLADSQASGENEHTITFVDSADQSRHTVQIRVDPAGFHVLSGCGDAQPGPSPAYTLVHLD